MSDPVLLSERNDTTLILTLNRPSAMNSLNGPILDALDAAFREAHRDSSVRVVILTGAGDRAFCAGADLKERGSMSEDEVGWRIERYREVFGRIARIGKPVICAINGYAFGGGLELAMACDLRLVARETKVGLTELGLGIIPGAGGTQRLPRLVGAAKAKELMFTAARLTGEEAAELGIANRCVDSAQLMDESLELARQIARSAPIALAQAKVAVDRGIEVDLESGLDIEAQCYAVTVPTEDRLEGLAAFRQKRDPEWSGT